MNTQAINHEINAQSIGMHMDWLRQIVEWRTESYFSDEAAEHDISTLPFPRPARRGAIDGLIERLDLDFAGRLIFLLALAPHVEPTMLDVFFVRNSVLDRHFTEFGGQQGKLHRGFLPTGETALFLLAGDSMSRRMEFVRHFQADHHLYREGVLIAPVGGSQDTHFSFPLELSMEFLSLILTGEEAKPDFSPDFPARRVVTELGWDDLVLSREILEDLHEIRSWIAHGGEVLNEWGLSRHLKPGYRSLFHGPPGTGKTLAATVLGKSTGRDVYRIDLSMVVSKYIGETEKNLGRIFDHAENREWLLFFDEADALFGKRTSTSSSNDRFANQQVSYLLQRIEDFPGVVLLATNFLRNMDEAFIRRFQSTIHFPKPDAAQRLQLWSMTFGDLDRLEAGVDFPTLAERYELTGGEIVNVLRYAVLRSFSNPGGQVTFQDIFNGIRREMQKAGRFFESM